ncbi:MAG: RdgB/HAM1 family non-canonical purine NTP pyrophosphatase [Planctomycetota bacterium]|nr:RdgB/HAM1 family non-canonical purine NTP pyrophosphatase [Planctomycetota bacterium]
MELLIASGNPKKLVEIELFLSGTGVEVLSPADVGGIEDVVEDRPTFEANAVKKACAAAAAAGKWTLADDSGLEVDHLKGAPGIHSARYSGTHGDDAANNQRLLMELQGVKGAERSARFFCALALARPDGELEATFEGSVYGQILEERVGTNDFGYDPFFLFTEEGHQQTGRGFAELEPKEKSEVSHRGRALTALREYLMATTQKA